MRKNTKQTDSLNELVHRRVVERIAAESHAQLLVEVLSKGDMKTASEMLQKLKRISGAAQAAGIKSLATAIKDASDDLNKFMGGSAFDILKGAAANLLKKLAGVDTADNPLVKCSVLIAGIEAGFSDLKDIVNNNIEDFNWKGDSIAAQAGENEKTVIDTIVKAFQPEATGFFSKVMSFFGAGELPYVESLNEFANEIVDAKPGPLEKLIAIAINQPISDAVSVAAKNIASGSEGSGTGVVSGASRQVRTIDDLASAVAAGESASGKSSPEKLNAAAEKDPKKLTQKFINAVSKKSGQPVDVVVKVVSALVKAGKLKSSVSESRDIVYGERAVILTTAAVLEARRLYDECGGSSGRWIDLLSEVKISDELKSKIEDIKKKIPGDNSKFKEKNIEDLDNIIKRLEKDEPLKTGDLQALRNMLKGPDGQKFVDELEELSRESGIARKGAKDFGDLDPKRVIDIAKDQKLKLDNRKDLMTLATTLKSQYGIDLKTAKEFIETKVVPLAKSGEKPSGILDKLKSRIDATKSINDLVDLLGKVDKNAVLKTLDNGQKVTAGIQAAALSKIAMNPQGSKDIIQSLLPDGGLKDKVEKLISSEKALLKGKHAKLIAAIKDSLSDVEPKAIVAVLDSLPEYIKAESKKSGKVLL